MSTTTLHLHYSTRELAETQGPVDFLAYCEAEGVELRSQPTFAQVGDEWVASAIVTVPAQQYLDPSSEPTPDNEER